MLGGRSEGRRVFQKGALQHRLALPRSTALILGALGRILSVFITLSLLNRQQRAVFRRSFRISDAVGTLQAVEKVVARGICAPELVVLDLRPSSNKSPAKRTSNRASLTSTETLSSTSSAQPLPCEPSEVPPI